jgi:hypothetical protein
MSETEEQPDDRIRQVDVNSSLELIAQVVQAAEGPFTPDSAEYAQNIIADPLGKLTSGIFPMLRDVTVAHNQLYLTFFMITRAGMVLPLFCPNPGDQLRRNVICSAVAEACKIANVDLIYVAFEAWIVVNPGEDKRPPSERPDRKECVCVICETRDRAVSQIYDIIRDAEDKIVDLALTDVIQPGEDCAMSGRFINLLTPTPSSPKTLPPHPEATEASPPVGRRAPGAPPPRCSPRQYRTNKCLTP